MVDGGDKIYKDDNTKMSMTVLIYKDYLKGRHVEGVVISAFEIAYISRSKIYVIFRT